MSANVKVVNLLGDLTLSTVDERAEEIRRSLESAPMVLLSLSRTTGIDLAGIQLLYAARRYAEKAGRSLHITGSVAEPVAQKLFKCGFTESLIRQGRDLDENLRGFSSEAARDA